MQLPPMTLTNTKIKNAKIKAKQYKLFDGGGLYPSGGSLHELEIYITVHACQGLAQGLYHYDPKTHALYFLSPITKEINGTLYLAKSLGHLDDRPQILFTIAARLDYYKEGAVGEFILGSKSEIGHDILPVYSPQKHS